jgi:hypothetical protein
MSDLEWYPADLVDEACPPSKSSAEAYAFFDGERWQLGYAHDDKSVLDEDREVYNRVIAAGAVVEFMTCERLGDIEVTLRRDGTFDLHGEIPRAYNVLIVADDSDLLYDGFEELIRALKRTDDTWANPSEMIFESGADTARVTLSFANWSDPLPHLFEVENGKPVFRPVPTQKN